jgi:hypothetical protein
MWAEIDVPERELRASRWARAVAFDLDGLGDVSSRARIEYVAPEVDRTPARSKARVR